MVKLVKFTRDSDHLQSNFAVLGSFADSYIAFLVIFKGNHILIYMYIFATVLLLGTQYCTSLHISIFSLELIRVNFSITFQNPIMFCRTII